MAADVKTSTYTTDYSKSLAEEVDSLITNMAPTDTPCVAMIGKDKCESDNPEWMEDTLGDAADNAQLEGFDAESVAITPPDKLENYTQILSKVFQITGTLDVVKKHGRKSELDYQTGLKTKELARDLERAVLNNTKNAGAAGTARRMDGVIAFAHASNTYSFGSAYSYTNHLTEEILNDVLQSMWELGAVPDTVLSPPAQKRKISNFTADGRLTINTQADAKKVTMTVRVLETDFGVVAIVPERHITPLNDSGTYYDRLLVMEKGRLDLLTLRPVQRTKLGQTGDHTKFMMLMEKSLRCRSKKAVGLVDRLTRVKA